MYVSRFFVFAGFLAGMVLFAQSVDRSAPLTEPLNSELPRWLRVGAEERVRMEYVAGSGFKPIGDLYLLNRLRVNTDVIPAPWLRFRFQAEDSRVFGQNTLPAPASQKNAMDLRVGYVQFASEEKGLVSMRLGRQILDFGDGRVLADPNWSNVGRTFDAARLTLRRGNLKVDLFSGVSVKIDATNFDDPAPGEHLHGAYGSVRDLVPGATIEPYVLWRLEHAYKGEDGRSGNLDARTAGVRWAGKLPWQLDYTAEIALQRGNWATDSVSAWMGHWVVGRTMPGPKGRTRVYFEYNRASGDADPKDGRHQAFDILFPASHDKYGLTDLFCSSNVVHLRPGVQVKLRRNLTAGAAYDDFWLASARDSLYVGGKSVARSTAGTAGTHVGREGDLQATWSVTPAMQVIVGYGRLFPGEFLKKTTSGVPYNIVSASVVQRF